ncbi:MAG: flagellar basal body L-ring protein FlgH [Betaproteobacteria bacterium]|nr:flagellar basal body L-ring protein FlgH [Betaproteobacteria bacterium]
MKNQSLARLESVRTGKARNRISACAVTLIAIVGVMPAMATSLYEESRFQSMVADKRAYKKGDVLTVQIIESSSASTMIDTGSQRKQGIGAEATKNGGQIGQAGLAASGEFAGGGRTQRSNRLLATVSVSVVDVHENGDFQVAGEQLLTVNDEVQKVSLRGRARPADVLEGNLILSTRLADSQITYVGEGHLSERSQRPWWRRILDGVGL